MPTEAVRTVVDTTDSELAAELFAAAYGPGVRFRFPESRGVRFRAENATADGVAVQRAILAADVAGRTDPLPGVVVAAVRSGVYRIEGGHARAEHEVVAGGAFQLDPSLPLEAAMHDVEMDTVMLPLDRVEAVARQLAPANRAVLDFSRVRPGTVSLEQHLLGAMERAQATVLGVEPVAELERAAAVFSLCATTVAAFGLLTDGDASSSPASIRRAVRFIEDELASPITVGDVAQAAGLSVRGLHAGFRASIGCSPLVYIRRARLDAVRAELLHADPASAGVVAIATRWGFSNPGRFAAFYRQEFGESPSATLRR